MSSRELGAFMRSIGQFATEEELQLMLQDVDIDGGWGIDACIETRV